MVDLVLDGPVTLLAPDSTAQLAADSRNVSENRLPRAMR
jgi:hypothetical protein